MANKNQKKNIKQFKQALLSNTGFIKEPEAEEQNNIIQPSVIEDIILADIREKFKILAAFEGTDEKELINKALNHYLRLKSLQLEEAMKNR